MNEETTFFEISGSGNFIRIELIDFAYPNAELDWDKNWVKGFVKVKAGGFSGEFTADFITVDFVNFKNEFAKLYDKLNGTATFHTLESQVEIKIVGDGIGHLTRLAAFRAQMLKFDYFKFIFERFSVGGTGKLFLSCS